MIDPDESSVKDLLTERGLAALLPVHQGARRLGCTVWNAKLFTPFGDAEAQIQLYPLAGRPESIVDFEEEITALTDSSSRVLAHEIRDQEWGILVTCSAKDAALFENFFEEGVPEARTPTYHPQLDRILGGDYYHQQQGYWLKACLGSIDRAMKLAELFKQAEQAYKDGPHWPGKLEHPMPALLAVLEIPATALKGAPERYNRRALMQFVIGSPEVIEMKPPEGELQVSVFARQLFGFLATQHHVGICFSRDAGCCIRPEFLCADGALTDAYFMARPTTPPELKRAMQTDLWNALIVTCETLGQNPSAIAQVLAIATVQYTRTPNLHVDVNALVANAAQGFVNRDTAGLEALLAFVFMKS